MEALIENYLLRYRYCPLPNIGMLQLQDGEAVPLHRDHIMTAPVPRILFSSKERDATPLIQYIANYKQISEEAAKTSLEQYCKKLSIADQYHEVKLEHTGSFYVDAYGKLCFKQIELPAEFLPSVPLKRVIHPNSVHNVRVGDTETTSVAMTEYYSETPEANSRAWWIAAAVMLLAAGIALAFYISGPTFNKQFGNGRGIVPAEASPTFRAK